MTVPAFEKAAGFVNIAGTCFRTADFSGLDIYGFNMEGDPHDPKEYHTMLCNVYLTDGRTEKISLRGVLPDEISKMLQDLKADSSMALLSANSIDTIRNLEVQSRHWFLAPVDKIEALSIGPAKEVYLRLAGGHTAFTMASDRTLDALLPILSDRSVFLESYYDKLGNKGQLCILSPDAVKTISSNSDAESTIEFGETNEDNEDNEKEFLLDAGPLEETQVFLQRLGKALGMTGFTVEPDAGFRKNEVFFVPQSFIQRIEIDKSNRDFTVYLQNDKYQDFPITPATARWLQEQGVTLQQPGPETRPR